MEGFYLDRAVNAFGSVVEAEIEAAQEKSQKRSPAAQRQAVMLVIKRRTGMGSFA